MVHGCPMHNYYYDVETSQHCGVEKVEACNSDDSDWEATLKDRCKAVNFTELKLHGNTLSFYDNYIEFFNEQSEEEEDIRH